MDSFLSFVKKRWTYIVIAIIALFIGSYIGPSQEELDSALADNDSLKKELSSTEKKLSSIEDENKKLSEKVEEATPYFEMEERERKIKEAEIAKQEAELKKKEEAAKAKAKAEAEAKEAAARAEQEKKEKMGYKTGITYNQLARTPDDFIGEKVKFRGKVVQVMEGDGTTQIRLAVNDDYDTILFGEFDSSLVKSRILEDDIITVMGTSSGLLTYESTMGGSISIPGVAIEKVEQ